MVIGNLLEAAPSFNAGAETEVDDLPNFRSRSCCRRWAADRSASIFASLEVFRISSIEAMTANDQQRL